VMVLDTMWSCKKMCRFYWSLRYITSQGLGPLNELSSEQSDRNCGFSECEVLSSRNANRKVNGEGLIHKTNTVIVDTQRALRCGDQPNSEKDVE